MNDKTVPASTEPAVADIDAQLMDVLTLLHSAIDAVEAQPGACVADQNGFTSSRSRAVALMWMAEQKVCAALRGIPAHA